MRTPVRAIAARNELNGAPAARTIHPSVTRQTKGFEIEPFDAADQQAAP